MDTQENHGATFTGEKSLCYILSECKDSEELNGFTGTCKTFRTLSCSKTIKQRLSLRCLADVIPEKEAGNTQKR